METKPTIKFGYEKKLIVNYGDLEAIVRGYRLQGKTIGAVAGVYDMIHDGHVKYMEMSKSFVDVLFLGLDDDELTRKNKGQDRPFDSLESRLIVLGGLSAIDHIKVRGVKESEEEFIRAVKPDVLIISHSSTQYTKEGEESFPELMKRLYLDTGVAKRIEALEPQSSNSTSAKMRELMTKGAKGLAQEILEVVEKRIGIPVSEIKSGGAK